MGSPHLPACAQDPADFVQSAGRALMRRFGLKAVAS